MRAIMAATILYSPLIVLVLLLSLVCDSPTSFYCRFYAGADCCVGVRKYVSSLGRVFKPNKPLARPIYSWSKHGYTCIYLPSSEDLAICMDVELNPGPTLVKPVVHHLLNSEEYGFSHCAADSDCVAVRHVYARDELLALCPFRINTLDRRRTHYMRYRGTRAGRLAKMKRTLKVMDIPTIVRPRTFIDENTPGNGPLDFKRAANLSNLIFIKPCLKAQNIRNSLSGTMSCSFGLLNCRSVRNKSVILKDYIVERNFDIFAITETWLRSADSDEVVIGDLVPTGYFFHHIPREARGGGVGIMLKRSLDAEIHRTGTSYTFFEAIGVHLKVLSRDIYILVIYRPPSSSGISSMNIFMEEFSSCLEHYIIKPGSLIIAGDFNFHFDKTSDAATVNFLSLLEAFDLRQHVTQVTHRAGHTLDLIITRNDDDGFLQSVNVHDSSMSDHFTVMCSLNIRKPCFQKKVVSSRKLKSIDFDALKSCIERSALLSHDVTDISQGVDLYNSELSRILDCHAPLATRVVTITRGAGMAQWLSICLPRKPPTNVARVRFPDSASNVG